MCHFLIYKSKYFKGIKSFALNHLQQVSVGLVKDNIEIPHMNLHEGYVGAVNLDGLDNIHL